MSTPTSPGVLAGLLVVAVLGRFRFRPDHRLRDLALHSGSEREPTRPAPTRLGAGRSSWRRRPPGSADLAAWCDTITRDLRSGATLGLALRQRPAPNGSVFADLPRRLGRGVPLAEAVRVEDGTPDEQAIATVLTACATAGGAAAEPLDRAAATLRRRAADDAERLVHSAQARLSAQVMTVIPIAVLALLITTSPTVRSSLGTPTGLITVAFGLALNIVGWRWMRRVIGGRR
jgi:tight adherence protein B